MNQPIPLKIEELRVGSVVRIGPKAQSEETIAMVTRIDTRDPFIYFDSLSIGVLIEDCEAIPLTPEVLEACGFKLRNQVWDHEHTDAMMCQSKRNHFYGFCKLEEYGPEWIMTGTQTLHILQLQFFALTGMELVYKP